MAGQGVVEGTVFLVQVGVAAVEGPLKLAALYELTRLS